MSNLHHHLVSIVIPCHNQGHYLVETVRSVWESTYKNIEIIIIDDGSTDSSLTTIQKLCGENKRMRYFHQKNHGPSCARNYGIDMAFGTFILPLDGDDKISPDYIEKAVHVFSTDQDVKVVYCLAEKFGEKTGKWDLKPFSLPSLATDNMIFVSGVFRKMDWEKAGGYDESMKWGWEDWEFWISMLKDGGEVVQLPITGFYYRICSQSRRKQFSTDQKRKAIDYLNTKHSDFFLTYLNGPLNSFRSQSRILNQLMTMVT